ncbi:MAG: 16S rRNA (guanine(527)-N(7))-methyltransferase RsmG [Dehalococcoidia bacterium]|nr:16S rRNA (guanine(527)-N(7))-methyltransferase RsmG [Dehalococcoidia bacterium]
MGQISGNDFTWDELPGHFPGFPDAGRWLPLLRRHHALLAQAEHEVPVTTVDATDAPRRLYAESLETLRLALEDAVDLPDVPQLIDIGSGGGFPGLVAAILLPGWRVVLVESLQKRAQLLDDAARKLGLENVEVVAKRAEDAGRDDRLRDNGDIVTARAVAELRVLVEYAGPLCRAGGVVALPKGSRLAGELDEARSALAELRLEVLRQADMRAVVSATPWTLLLRKVGETPGRYPRRAGVPAKRPL